MHRMKLKVKIKSTEFALHGSLPAKTYGSYTRCQPQENQPQHVTELLPTKLIFSFRKVYYLIFRALSENRPLFF